MTLYAPEGYASYIDPSRLPENRCQKLVGWFPARYGVMRPAWQLRPLTTFTFDVVAVFVYYSSDSLHDKLLVVRSNAATAPQLYSTPLTGVFGYNAYGGKQHVKITLGSFTLVGSLPGLLDPTDPYQNSPTNFSIPCNGCRAVQFKDELIIMDQDNGALCRYWVDSSGVESLKRIQDIPPLFADVTPLAEGAAGNITEGTYYYAIALIDDKSRPGLENRGYSASLNRTPISFAMPAGHSSKVTINLGSGLNGKTVRVFRTKANTTSPYYTSGDYVVSANAVTDNVADVNLGAPLTLGQNNPPLAATMAAVYKNRLVLNNVTPYPVSASTPTALNQIQIGNADSPVQFSVVPTIATDGTTINCGSDTGDQVTGLGNLGSLLAIFMRRSIKLLQGSDPVTAGQQFEVIEAHKRGGENHNSIVRADNVVAFLSNDGIWELGYQSGFAIQSLSSEIRDFFYSYADTVGNGNPSDFVNRVMAAATTGSMTGFYMGRRLFISMPMNTLVYDYTAQGWADTGWGLISSAAVFKQAGDPESAFLLPRTAQGTKPRTLYWINDAQQWDDPDALPTMSATELSRVFDGGGIAAVRRKRGVRFTLFGDSAKPKGTQIGTLTIMTDSNFSWTTPIYAYVTMGQNQEALFSVDMPRGVVGRELTVQYTITDPSCTIEEKLYEYVSLDEAG